jgi:hypothetical protein
MLSRTRSDVRSADCLARLRLIGPDDLPAVGLHVFPAYLGVCRKLQRTYWLGKRWQCLGNCSFLLVSQPRSPSVQNPPDLMACGLLTTTNFWCFSSDLVSCTVSRCCWRLCVCLRECICLADHKHIRPRSVLSSEILEGFTKQYMYLGAIQFIIDVSTLSRFSLQRHCKCIEPGIC